jgi:hypothetical protein
MVKRTSAAVALALGAAALVWTAGILYYQRKVARAVGLLRQEHLLATAPGAYAAPPSAGEVAALGCRALPALMAELDPALNPYYLCRVADCLTDLSDGEAPRVVFEEDPAQRRKSVDALRAWWEGGGRRRHDWWRFWTSKCVR